MTLKEANALQCKIAATHPNLGISVKKVGADNSDEWVCFIDTKVYYLWNECDWIEYRTIRRMQLWIYTEEGRKTATEKQKQAIQASRAPVL